MLRIEAGPAARRRRVANSRLAFTDARAGHARPSSAWAGCCAACATTTAPFVGGAAIRRELRRGHVALGDASAIVVDWQDWDRAAPRRRAAAAQGRAPAALRVGAVRRTTGGRRSATSPASCTPPCCSATSAWPGCAPTSPTPGTAVHLELALNHHNTTVPARTATAAPVQPREEDGQAMSDRQLDHARRTTRSWSAAATTGWSTPATSPRRACARWCSSSATWSAARRSPRSCVPGFSFTTFSYALSLLRPEIIHELDLVQHGFMPLMMPSLVPPHRRRRLPAARRRPRPEHPGDPAALAARRRRLRPLPPRPRPGRAGGPAAVRQRRRRTCSARTPRTRPTSRGCSTTSAASSRR